MVRFSILVRSAEPPPRTVRPANAKVVTYSLANDFSSTENRADSIWSYRLDDSDRNPALPLLTSASRDANALWGSDFPTPPIMWSEVAGYWGIGKNVTGRELISTRNGATWKPGEVLLHPKGARLSFGSGHRLDRTRRHDDRRRLCLRDGFQAGQRDWTANYDANRQGRHGCRGLAEHRWRPPAIISQESPYPPVTNCFSDAIAMVIPPAISSGQTSPSRADPADGSPAWQSGRSAALLWKAAISPSGSPRPAGGPFNGRKTAIRSRVRPESTSESRA